MISQTSTRLRARRHTHAMTHTTTRRTWRLAGHPRVARGHGVSRQSGLCRRPRVLPWHISPYFSWQNPARTVRPFCHGAVGVATSQGTPGQQAAGALWFCPQRLAVATETPGRVSRVPGPIVTHGLPCCPVEMEAPCRHTPGTAPGESPVCPGPRTTQRDHVICPFSETAVF